MARMVPTYENEAEFRSQNPRQGNNGLKNGWDAEWAMYGALSKLPNRFTVLHSWKFELAPSGGGRRIKGEADFIVLGPSGVLVIEVKSKPLICDENGRWHAVNNPRGKPLGSPFEEAERGLSAVVERLKGMAHESGGGEILWRKNAHVLCECAVAFPLSDYGCSSPLPEGWGPAKLIDCRTLQEGMEAFVERLFEHRKSFLDAALLTGLTEGEISEAVSRLMPGFFPKESDGPRIVQETQELDYITSIRVQTPTRSERENWGRFTIRHGISGSGKTLLAQRWARQAAAEGRRTLLLCFNSLLAKALQAEPLNRGFDIFTFHGLAAERAAQASLPGREPPPPNEGAEKIREFYEHRSPEMLLEATRKLQGERGDELLYDVIIVDEAQDIRRAWWPVIRAQLADPDRSELHLLMDEAQEVFCKETGLPQEMKSAFRELVPLTRCHRNTRSIQAFVSKTSGITLESVDQSPAGLAPQVEEAEDARDVTERLERLVTRLRERDGIRLDQIAVLCDHSYSKAGCVLNGCGGRIGGAEIITPQNRPGGVLFAWKRGEGLLVTTPRSFKGLEADVVILAGMDGFRDTFDRSDLYVAQTRAKARLYAICLRGEVLDCLRRGTFLPG